MNKTTQKTTEPVDLSEFLLFEELSPNTTKISLNKHLIKTIGPIHTLYLSILLDLYQTNIDKNYIEDDEPFICPHKEQIENSGLSEYQIRKSKSFFQKIGVLKVVKKGTPAREFYLIDHSKIEFLFYIDNPNVLIPKKEISKINLVQKNIRKFNK